MTNEDLPFPALLVRGRRAGDSRYTFLIKIQNYTVGLAVVLILLVVDFKYTLDGNESYAALLERKQRCGFKYLYITVIQW